MTNKESDFLQNVLLPNELKSLKDGQHLNMLKLLIHAHNPDNLIPFDEILESKQLTIEEYYERAFENTLNWFFLEIKAYGCKPYFSKSSINSLKDDFLEFFQYNRFYNFGKRIYSVEFYIFLKHLYQTFVTLDLYDRNERLSHGTAFMTSGYRNGLEHSYKLLQDRLDPKEPFSLTFQDSVEQNEVNLFCIKSFRNHLDVANMMIICNAMHNFNDLKIDFSEGEKAGLKQSFSFLNGLKTSKQEVIRSFMIKTYFPYYRNKKVNKDKLAKFTHRIAEKFFPDIVFPREKTKQYTIGLSPRVFKYNLYIKTALMENLIYAYDHKNEYTFLIKGSIKDALRFVKKIYLDEGQEEIVNHPLFDQVMRKILKNPMYPI